ncbi:beta-lactamase/transpeptidase-like protein [Atractiella rhizophila]|nr:beta-lactamase/transpeptidase-like protein [Atractiella rhizophila]
MMPQIFPFLFCILVTLGAQIPFQPGSSSSRPKLVSPALGSFVNHIQSKTGVPGIGLGVVKLVDGVWVEETVGFGKASDAVEYVDGNTLFSIASNSKAFTALAYSFLQDGDGRELSYRQKVKDLLPDWSLKDPVAQKQASVLDLLSHRTGMPRHDLAYAQHDDWVVNQRKLGALKPSAEFREHWQYNNMMYITVGRIIALHSSHTPLRPNVSSLTAMDGSFESFLTSHIFSPLHMSDTSFSPDLYPERRAKGYMLLSNGTSFEIPLSPDNEVGRRFIAPTGGIVSTPKDVNTWMKFLVDSARKAEGWSYGLDADYLRPEAVKEMISAHMVENSRVVKPDRSPYIYGLGVSRFRYRGKDLVWHSGGITGFGSTIAWSPLEGVGVAVLTNNMGIGNAVADAIVLRAFEELVGLEPAFSIHDVNSMSVEDIVTKYSFPSPSGTTSNVHQFRWQGPSLPIERFEGKYHSEGYGTIHICLAQPSATATTPAECDALRFLRAESTQIVDPSSSYPEPELLLAKDSFWFSLIAFSQVGETEFKMTYAANLVDYKGVKREFTGVDYGIVNLVLRFTVDGETVKGFELRGAWGSGADVEASEEAEDYLVRVA